MWLWLLFFNLGLNVLHMVTSTAQHLKAQTSASPNQSQLSTGASLWILSPLKQRVSHGVRWLFLCGHVHVHGCMCAQMGDGTGSRGREPDQTREKHKEMEALSSASSWWPALLNSRAGFLRANRLPVHMDVCPRRQSRPTSIPLKWLLATHIQYGFNTSNPVHFNKELFWTYAVLGYVQDHRDDTDSICALRAQFTEDWHEDWALWNKRTMQREGRGGIYRRGAWPHRAIQGRLCRGGAIHGRKRRAARVRAGGGSCLGEQANKWIIKDRTRQESKR